MAINIAEKKKEMEELKVAIEAAVKKFNEAEQLDERNKLEAEINENLGKYNTIATEVCFQECANAPDAMLEAIKRISYETLNVRDTKTDLGTFVRTVNVRERTIDLMKLHKFVEGGIGANKKWYLEAEAMNRAMTLQAALDLGVAKEDITKINDSYAMSELAAQIDMGKNPCSKTQLLKTLTKVVQAMIGEEYKPVSHDVNFLMRVYSKKSRKALTVTCANHKYMREYLMNICNRIVTGGTYKVEYREKR